MSGVGGRVALIGFLGATSRTRPVSSVDRSEHWSSTTRGTRRPGADAVMQPPSRHPDPVQEPRRIREILASAIPRGTGPDFFRQESCILDKSWLSSSLKCDYTEQGRNLSRLLVRPIHVRLAPDVTLLRGRKARAFISAVTWLAMMVFLWAPWNGFAVVHGKNPYFERLYGMAGYYVVHYPKFGPVTSRINGYMLACTAAAMVAVTLSCLNDVLKGSPRCGKSDKCDPDQPQGSPATPKPPRELFAPPNGWRVILCSTDSSFAQFTPFPLPAEADDCVAAQRGLRRGATPTPHIFTTATATRGLSAPARSPTLAPCDVGSAPASRAPAPRTPPAIASRRRCRT